MNHNAHTIKRGLHDALRMTYYALLSFFVVLLSVHGAFAADQPKTIVIVQSGNVSAYQDALDGFLRTLEKQKSKLSLTTTFYDSPDKFSAILAHAKSLKPADVIITIGSSATVDMARRVQDTPIVFSMVLDPQELVGSQKNIVGASLNIPDTLQLKMIKEVLPQVETVGVIYDPARNTTSVKDLVRAANQLHLRMRTFPVTSQKEIPDALSQVEKEADMLLGIVDNTVYTAQTAKYIISYTIKKQLPFIGISQVYVKAGALCSFVFDNKDIGRQAAELTLQIIAGTSPSALQDTTPEKLELAINLRTAELIGLNIPKSIRESAEVVYE